MKKNVYISIEIYVTKTDELLCSRQDVHCLHITDMTFITFPMVIVSHEGQFQRSAPFGSFLVLPGTSTEKKLKKLHIMLLSSDVHWVEHFLLIKKEWWMRKWQSTFRLLWGIHPIKPMHSKEVFQGFLIFKPLLSSLLATRRWLWIWEVWFVSLLVSVEMEFLWHSRRQRGFHVEVTLWLTRTDLPHMAQNLQRIRRRSWKPRDHGKGLLFHGQVKRKKSSNLWAQDVPPLWWIGWSNNIKCKSQNSHSDKTGSTDPKNTWSLNKCSTVQPCSSYSHNFTVCFGPNKTPVGQAKNVPTALLLTGSHLPLSAQVLDAPGWVSAWRRASCASCPKTWAIGLSFGWSDPGRRINQTVWNTTTAW